MDTSFDHSMDTTSRPMDIYDLSPGGRRNITTGDDGAAKRARIARNTPEIPDGGIRESSTCDDPLSPADGSSISASEGC